MKTRSILLFTIIISFSGCKNENTNTIISEPKVQTSQIRETDNISEETKEKETLKKEQAKETTKTDDPMNVLDMQAKIYTDVLGNIGGVEELQGIDGFMDLVEKMDAPPETKTQLTAQYELYSTSLDPEKKAELKAKFSKMLLEANNKHN